LPSLRWRNLFRMYRYPKCSTLAVALTARYVCVLRFCCGLFSQLLPVLFYLNSSCLTSRYQSKTLPVIKEHPLFF
jgi:hypothetical protein